MRIAELVRGYAPADPGRDGGAMQLKASGAGRPRVPARGSGDHAEQRADRTGSGAIASAMALIGRGPVG